MNLCGVCGEDFETLAAFDEHRVGFHAFTYQEGLRMDPSREDGRRCLAVAELVEFGWAKGGHDRWIYPRDWEPQAWRWELSEEEVAVA